MEFPDGPNALIAEELARLTEIERQVIDRFIHRQGVGATAPRRHRFRRSVADRVAAFGGSWTFILLAVAAIGVWLSINLVAAKAFDPYPFILLNLVLSCLAALQAPIIMMSQNRQSAKDRIDAKHDYEVNLKAEIEILALHGSSTRCGRTSGRGWCRCRRSSSRCWRRHPRLPGRRSSPAARSARVRPRR